MSLFGTQKPATMAIEEFEMLCGTVLTKSVHKLMGLTGSEDPVEVNAKMTCVFQRLAQQIGMVEEMIVEKTFNETKKPRTKVRQMLNDVRIQAESAGKAWMKARIDDQEKSKIIVPSHTDDESK